MGDTKKYISTIDINENTYYIKDQEAKENISLITTDINDLEDKIGNTDISTVGDGTITGAIAELNANHSSEKVTVEGKVLHILL